ncbi:unnamed protein product [Rhizophagus irregularis]|nr:unnamed protein product [Rhizophagus irregularis]
MPTPKSISSSSRENLVHGSSKSQSSRYKGRVSATRSLYQGEASLERGRSPTSRPFRLERSPHRRDISLERSGNTLRSFRQEEEASLERGRRNSFRQERSLHQEDVSLERGNSTSRPFRQEEETSLERGPFRLEYGSLNGRYKKGELEEESEDDYENIRRQEKNKKRREKEIRNQEEIEELRLAILNMEKEFKEFRQAQTATVVGRKRTRLSSSPEPLTEYSKRGQMNLEPMNYEYKKAFRDEVVQVLKGLDNSLSIDLFDCKKKWTDIEKCVLQEIIPAIKKALDNNRFQYTDTELKKVLQNLHRHQRDSYTISTNTLKFKANKQRIRTNSRRKDKKERRRRGFHHMLTIRDSILTDLQPSSMEWDEWVEDIRKVIEDSNYHSDEVSESDDEKAQNEKDDMIRPAQKEDSNHVLHVYDKPWRSSKARRLLRYADETGEKIQNIKKSRKRWYNDNLYIENSKPPSDASEWTISTTYQAE